MPMPAVTHQLLFAANLTFILTNLYGWLLKWFYKPKAYHEDFNQLFPAYRSVGWLYLLQAFELPYLLHVGQPEALLYVNAFALLVYPIPIQTKMICDMSRTCFLVKYCKHM